MGTLVLRAGSNLAVNAIVVRFTEKAKKKADLVIRQTAISMFSFVIIESPVDTGRFRGNWFATLTQPSTKVTKATNRDSIPPMVQVVKRSASASKFILTNNLPYANKLEFGHSAQAPSGMVRRALRKAPGFLKQAVRNLK